MASCGNPEVETEALMSRRSKYDKSRFCVKCKTNVGNIVIRHAVYCKECFTPLQTTKFKRALEPCINPASASSSGPRRTKLKATGNLLVGFSGGLGSTVLLDLVRRCYYSSQPEGKAGDDPEKPRGGSKHPRNQSVWKEARICYVEICGAFPESKIQDRTNEVRKIISKYEGFELVPLKIEDAFDPAWWEKVGGGHSSKDEEQGIDLSDEDLHLVSLLQSNANPISPLSALRDHLARLPTPTAVQSTIRTLTRLLLLYTAYATSSSHLLLGTTLTGLSIGLISGVATGGGFVVREEAGEEWTPGFTTQNDRKITVKVVRPLKDMGMKECAAWIWWNGLEMVGRAPGAASKQDIGGLTKDFIVGLERDYPSTVSTIARTCAKLAPKDGATERCAMCERPAQKGVQDWKARISIRSFDTLGVDAPLPPHINQLSSPPPSDSNHASPTSSLTPHLCYACHTTLTSRSSRGTALLQSKHSSESTATPLPTWVTSQLGQAGVIQENGEVSRMNKIGNAEMKDQIKDFLLEE